jgi:hypothetical protein
VYKQIVSQLLLSLNSIFSNASEKSEKMGKDKRKSINESQNGDAAADDEVPSGPSYDDQMKFISIIAKPMASEDLAKKVPFMFC